MPAMRQKGKFLTSATSDGSDPTFPAVLAALRAAVGGPVLTPDQDGYRAEIAGFDLAQDHRPPIAVSAATAADVVATVRIAAAAGLPITVIGGGHGDIPRVTDGIVLTTRRLTDVRLDIADRTAVVGAGATWHAVLDVATPAGLAPLCGSAPAVGVVGYLLGGGMGPIGRTFGFSSDHVRSFDIVLADGELRTASAERDPELFWALRGGKGGLGVVTSATVELLQLSTICGGGQYYSAADIPELLRAYQRFVGSAVPDSLTTSLAILRLPDLPMLPPPLRGQTVAQLRIGFVGPAAEAEVLLAPLRAAVAPPILGASGELPYAEIGTIHNDPTLPSAHATAGILLDRLDADTVEAVLAVAGPDVPTPLAIVEIRHLGGAFAGPASPRDAVSGREAAFGIWVSGAPMPVPFDPAAMANTEAAVRDVLDALAPWSTGAVQINFCGSVNTAQEAAAAWPPEIAERITAVRRRSTPSDRVPVRAG